MPDKATADAVVLLGYAPRGVRRGAPLIVIGAGVITTTLVLAGTQVEGPLQDLMGFYLKGCLPVGAIIVGLLAGSGYGIASWTTGFRIRRWLLWSVLAMQLTAYATAQYAAFVAQGPLVDATTGQRVNFAHYMHVTITSTAWESPSRPGHRPLGVLGYAVKMLEMAGFSAGALAVPLGLMKHPYCHLCQAYMRKQRLAEIRASAPYREVSRGDAAKLAAYGAEQQAEFQAGLAALAAIESCAAQGDIERFKALLPPAWKEQDHLPCRISLSLSYCKRCRQGHLSPVVVTGQESDQRREELVETQVSSEFVGGLISRS